MLNKLIIFCLMFVSVVGSSEAGWLARLTGIEYDFSETATFVYPESQLKRWKVVDQTTTRNGFSLLQAVPKNETLEKHTELLTITFYAHTLQANAPKSAKEWMDRTYAQNVETYPDLQWNTLSQTDNDVMYEWILPNGFKTYPPQHEIVRFLWTPKGIHRVAYEKKVPQLEPQEREMWIEAIRKGRVAYR